MAISIKIMLDFEFVPAYAGCLVPVHLSEANNSSCKLHLRHPFALSPTPSAIAPTQPGELTDCSPGGNRLDIGKLTEDLEIHVLRIGSHCESRNPPPNETPAQLGFVSTVMSAIAMGHTVVAVPSACAPLAATVSVGTFTVMARRTLYHTESRSRCGGRQGRVALRPLRRPFCAELRCQPCSRPPTE